VFVTVTVTVFAYGLDHTPNDLRANVRRVDEMNDGELRACLSGECGSQASPKRAPHALGPIPVVNNRNRKRVTNTGSVARPRECGWRRLGGPNDEIDVVAPSVEQGRQGACQPGTVVSQDLGHSISAAASRSEQNAAHWRGRRHASS
jgi:hypothetical protein